MGQVISLPLTGGAPVLDEKILAEAHIKHMAKVIMRSSLCRVNERGTKSSLMQTYSLGYPSKGRDL